MQTMIRISKKSFHLLLLALFLYPAAACGQTSPPAVGLVTGLTGEATCRNKEEKKPARLGDFMKVRPGDNIKLAKNSSLTLLYFADGRQETWKGPAALVAGKTASKAKGGKNAAAPAVKIMPPSAIKKITAAPFLSALPTAATAQVKPSAPAHPGVCKLPPPGPSPAEAQKIMKKGETVYQELKQKAGPDNFTPELYFLGVLAQCRRYSEMNQMLDKMLQKKPGDPGLKEMKVWVRRQTLCGG